ncbi:MAG: hypothetical protein Q9206_006754, partial [Seirophora lacunosa]
DEPHIVRQMHDPAAQGSPPSPKAHHPSMERQPKSLTDAVNLLRTCELLTAAVHTVIASRDPQPSKPGALRSATNCLGSYRHPHPVGFRATKQSRRSRRPVLGEPRPRGGCTVVERRIPKLLVTAGTAGASAEKLGSMTGIEKRKLSRILRCLCSIHIFREITPDLFANNSISMALVHNEPLRAYVLTLWVKIPSPTRNWRLARFRVLKLDASSNLDAYTASDHLPTYLLGPDGHSYSVEKTAWQKAIGTTKPRWDWLEEEVTHEEGSAHGIGYPGVVAGDVAFRDQPPATKLRRPEHEIFSLAMVGGGRIFGAAHPYVHPRLHNTLGVDYPWNSLGEATIVDVGGGVGGFDMQLWLYPKLNFVIQDRGPVLQRAAQNTWPKEISAALTDGRVRFMEHDFFNPNPVHGAEVYWLRYILHDWADDYCVRILSAIRAAMVPRSRILICDQVMNTTNGCAEFRSAPKPLLANYRYYTRYSHQRDLCMIGTLNGIERTPAQFEVLIENAGLKLEKIWECRSQVNIIEVRLRGTPIEEDGEVANGANRHHDRTKNPDELPTPAF